MNPTTHDIMKFLLKNFLSVVFLLSTAMYTFADEEIPLVLEGALWKYLDDGNDLGTAWRESDYDDSSWKSGAPPAGSSDCATVTRAPIESTPLTTASA